MLSGDDMNMMNDKRNLEGRKEKVLRWKRLSPTQQDMRSRGGRCHDCVKLGLGETMRGRRL